VEKPRQEKLSQSQPISFEQRIEGLRRIADRCQLVIDNLSGNSGWDAVMEDLSAQKQQLDDTWQYVSDAQKWIEFRVTKMAVAKILNVVNDYKSDKQVALDELYKLENPDKTILKDVDNG